MCDTHVRFGSGRMRGTLVPVKRRVAALVGALALAAACSSGGNGGTAAPAPGGSAESTTTTTAAPFELETEVLEEIFTDGERDRTLRTLIRYPTGAGPYPLVAFSHGLTARPETYTAIITEIVQHGYVVAAPEFPNTSGVADNPRGSLLDVNNQPADVSFVIDEVLRLADESDGPLAGLVDAERIGAAGHSLGAITTLLTGFHTCCTDDRIDGAVALAGGALFGTGDGGYFEGAARPLLMLHGDEDGLVLFSLGRMAFNRAAPPKYFVTLIGGEHTLPFVGTEPWFEPVEASILAFLDHYVAGDADALDRLPDVAEIEGVAELEAVEG